MNNILSQIHRIDFKPSYNLGDLIDISLPAKKHNDSDALVEFRSVLEQYTSSNKMEIGKNYKITVKQYMTEPATISFDFQDKWNNGIPMPMVTMVGKVIKETRGMIYMELQGRAEATCNCLHCGRTLTNKVSMLYGIGPICGQHYGINPFDTEEELNEHFEELKSQISDIKWSGWVIKSAIKQWEEVDN